MKWLTSLGIVAAILAVTLVAIHVYYPRALGASATFMLIAQHNPCANCHMVHTAPGQSLTNETVREVLCQTCHSIVGSATPTEVHTNKVGSGYPAFSITCTDCHEPHDYQTNANSKLNLKLVRQQIQTPNSGAMTVLFESRGTDAVPPGPSLYSFADADEDNDTFYTGVCEVCHTQALNHRNNATGTHTHYAGQSCVQCHPHDDYFRGSGGCQLCHNTAQGSRRAIVPEFSWASHHLQSTLEDADCQVCHDQSQHQQGSVRLKNADGGATIVLTGDPNTVPTEAAKLTVFCLACHDPAGTGPTQPFTDLNVPPTVDSTLWTASSHNLASPSCYGTSGCHASAHGSQKLKLLAPATVPPTPPANAEEEEGFCFTCHDGIPAVTNIQGEFQKGTNTSTQTFHHPVNDNEQSVGRTVECTDCHNPHQATSANKLRGVTGIDLAGTPVGPGTVNPRDIVEYEECLQCHGDTYNAGRDINADTHIDTSNKRLDFAANASAYHPVQQAGRNQSGALQAQLLGGLTTGSTILCSDCHNNEQTADSATAGASLNGPQGPHGSTIYPVLRDTSDLRTIQLAGGATANQFQLCFVCHSQQALIGAATFALGARTNFYGGSVDNLHEFHVAGFGGVTCRSCHYNTHGNQSASNTIYRIIDGATTDYASPPVGYKTRMVSFGPDSVRVRLGELKPVFRINVATRDRGCLLVCHGTDHTGGADYTFNPQATHGQPGQDNDSLIYIP